MSESKVQVAPVSFHLLAQVWCQIMTHFYCIVHHKIRKLCLLSYLHGSYKEKVSNSTCGNGT